VTSVSSGTLPEASGTSYNNKRKELFIAPVMPATDKNHNALSLKNYKVN